MKKNTAFAFSVASFGAALILFALVPMVSATWHTAHYQCSPSPGQYCGVYANDSLELLTHVDSTSPATYICAGYTINTGTNAGHTYCNVVYSSGNGKTFNNDGTQTVSSFYFDCTSTVCLGYQGVATNLYFTDSIYIN